MLKHTFVICAYKESAYLRDCIQSLLSQSIKSIIICCTSTPNNHIKSVCDDYDIELRVNSESNGLAADWNFAYAQAKTDLVTIAHQDDIYEPTFVETTLKYICLSKKPLIAFTDYYEIRDEGKVSSNMLLRIKRILSLPWRLRFTWGSRFVTRRIFMFGNPICCPAVTFSKQNITFSPIFDVRYKNSCDWVAWINIRNLKGDFIFVPKLLMGHRIHEESETTAQIENNNRSKEDLQIMETLMPKGFAKIIHAFYIKGQDSNG